MYLFHSFTSGIFLIPDFSLMYSQQTYFANFGEQPEGDITQVDASAIPNHDILVAGFLVKSDNQYTLPMLWDINLSV